METVVLTDVSKEFSVKQTEQGLKNNVKSFFSPNYKKISALKDVSFHALSGEILGLLGENGAGKTTIIKILSGILSPSSGSVSVLGFNPFLKQKKFKEQISLLLGNKNQLWWDLPPMESFYITSKIYGMNKADYEKNAEELISLLGIGPFVNSPVRSLSLGQKMRCEIANALLHLPKLILLDEPTLGLDISTQHIIRKYIRNYVSMHDSTCIITSHYLKDITSMCDRVVILHHGRKVTDEDFDTFAASCADKMTVYVNTRDKDNELLPLNTSAAPDDNGVAFTVSKDELSKFTETLYGIVSPQYISFREPPVEALIEEKLMKIQTSEDDYED